MWIGRKNTYFIYFVLGACLYALIPAAGHWNSLVLFVVCCAIIMSMYGGGFATVPAYLRDLFGTLQVGAVHGRLLTAWSAAGVAGPSLVNYIRQYQIEHGVAKAQAYDTTMYLDGRFIDPRGRLQFPGDAGRSAAPSTGVRRPDSRGTGRSKLIRPGEQRGLERNACCG